MPPQGPVTTMIENDSVHVDFPADIQQYDETGYIWTLREDARDPSLVVEGAIVVAGDSEDPFLARVVDVLPANEVTKVHLEVLPGDPTDYVAALRWAPLLSA
jgi:hypothetical protein